MDVGGGVLRGTAGLFCVSSLLPVPPPPEARAPVAAPRATDAREDGRHWSVADVSWDALKMVATPAAPALTAQVRGWEATGGAVRAASGPLEAAAEAAAPSPLPQQQPRSRAPGVCCQVPGCTQSPSDMREYNNRCRCARAACCPAARCACPARRPVLRSRRPASREPLSDAPNARHARAASHARAAAASARRTCAPT
jgi:hypothetical protein